MEEEPFTREDKGRLSGFVGKVCSYAAGMLVEVLTVVALCAAAVLIMLVVKAVA